MIKILGMIAAMVCALQVSADGITATKIEDVIHNKKFSEDRRITDNELKAQAGSLSRYSMKFDLSYMGPPVGNLADHNIPNPDNRPGDNRTSMAGFIGLRYRVNQVSGFSAGTGLRWYTPYQKVTGEEVKKDSGAKDYDFTNPSLSYDRTYALAGAQMRSSIKTALITNKYYTQRGEYASLGFTQSGKYNIDRLVLSLSADVDFYGFNRDYNPKTDGKISNYYLTFIPGVEYKLTDKMNVRTSVGYSHSNMRKYGNWWLWEPVEPMARLGLGYAFTREIYFHPYLNFFWEHPALTTTSLSFSTVFSIF